MAIVSGQRCATCGVDMAIAERAEQRYCGKKCRKRGRNQAYRANRARRGLPRNGPAGGAGRAER